MSDVNSDSNVHIGPEWTASQLPRLGVPDHRVYASRPNRTPCLVGPPPLVKTAGGGADTAPCSDSQHNPAKKQRGERGKPHYRETYRGEHGIYGQLVWPDGVSVANTFQKYGESHPCIIHGYAMEQ